MNQEQQFKDLIERRRKLSEVAIRINTQIEQAHFNQKKLIEQAQRQFGAATLDELIKLRDKWQKKNDEIIEKLTEDIKEKEREIAHKSQVIKQIQNGE